MTANHEDTRKESTAPRVGVERIVSWFNAKFSLPFDDLADDYKHCVFGRFMVCVELDSHESGDSREVLVLRFHSKNNEWRTEDNKKYDFGWKVTHWANLPDDPFENIMLW